MTASIRLQEWLSVRKRARDLLILRRLLAPWDGVRLLDLGGGAGGATERFSAGSAEIVVLEPDARKVALGSRRRPWIRFVQGHSEQIPFPDAHFDRIVSIVAFHHFEDQDRALEEMRRVLRPSGRIGLLELPPSRSPGRFMRWIGGLSHQHAMTFLEPDDLRLKLASHAFRDVSCRQGANGYIVAGQK